MRIWQANANDYAWEGVPAWGPDEELRRRAREDARRARAGAENGNQDDSMVDMRSTSISNGPTERAGAGDSVGGDHEYEHPRARGMSRMSSFESMLAGVGGGKDLFHDPDQFSLWRKGWMASDVGGAGESASERAAGRPVTPASARQGPSWRRGHDEHDGSGSSDDGDALTDRGGCEPGGGRTRAMESRGDVRARGGCRAGIPFSGNIPQYKITRGLATPGCEFSSSWFPRFGIVSL